MIANSSSTSSFELWMFELQYAKKFAAWQDQPVLAQTEIMLSAFADRKEKK